ncbi:hypothetical protein L596_016085 [Steinernema carpocapsae]|uniref:BHLH domain-containing protein n=1 Tax=Steinernema carpocapsae TaxID=34508 RepID=A0A4U5NHR3_STECR|nr:hypothetical protein L596_016085 [Steinernema carpocapsae]
MTPSLITVSSRHGLDTVSRKRKLSEGEDFSDTESASSPKSASPSMDDDRRQHHNELERRRRDNLKDFFNQLKEQLPLMDGEKTSRASILNKAINCIKESNRQRAEKDEEIRHLKKRLEFFEASNVSPIISIKQPELPVQSSQAFAVPTTSALNPISSYPAMPLVPTTSATPLSLNSRLPLDSLSFKTQPSLLSTNDLLTTSDILSQLIVLQQQQKLQQVPLHVPTFAQPQPLKPVGAQNLFDLHAQVLARGMLQA